MFNLLIILTAVINLTCSQVASPDPGDSVAILGGLASSQLECSIKFDREFVESNSDLQAVIEAHVAQLSANRQDGDASRRPRNERHVDSEEVDEESEDPRRNLGKRRDRGDATREPREDGADGATREPRDSTKEPCDGDDCQRRRRNGRRSKGDSTREPCDDDEEEAEDTTEAPLLRRNLGRGRGRGDVTREPDATNRLLERNGQAHRQKEDVTEEPLDAESAALRKKRQRKRRRERFVDATISDGIVDIDGVVGEVVFGEVDEEMESVPLTLTLGGTSFSCDVEVRRNGNSISCRGVSEDDFRVRLGCAIASEDRSE